MSKDDHKSVANNIKTIHKKLRELSKQVGYKKAWELHMKDEETRESYAKSMKELAKVHWSKNQSSDDRIKWTIDYCETYFNQELEKWYQKELRALKYLNLENFIVPEMEIVDKSMKLETLDVGSSGNFFQEYERFQILPIDISPSDSSVYSCDFTSVELNNSLEIEDERKIIKLPRNFYHIVIFCLLLEYLPSSEMRVKCCEKAYEVLKSQGILIIITPDSSHETKNSKLIKYWRWTLAQLGFQRVKWSKLTNLTCLAFRKSIHPEIPQQWSRNNTESYMTSLQIEIPQDRNKDD
jgi:25S rRNA (adenine2142-N1)-methyltransferase